MSIKNNRPVDGILLLNKPCNMSSNAALQRAKYLYSAKKAGHTGSLDPLATGMLPICFGEATKFSQYLLDADKCYRVTLLLGIKTTTGDAEGKIIATHPVNNLSTTELETVLAKFRGAIWQIPSMFSALKYQGRPLYELARQGITVERPARQVIIHKLILLEQTAETLTLEVVCSKGTYIRNLVEDIGDELGCGAHVIKLHRLSAGAYNEQQMISLENLQHIAEDRGSDGLDALLVPLDTALDHLPSVILPENILYFLQHGQATLLSNTVKRGPVKILSESNDFVGVGEMQDNGKLAPKRLIKNTR